MMEDMTPTWVSLVRPMIAVIQNNKFESVEAIEQELLRMAYAADLWNQHVKSKE